MPGTFAQREPDGLLCDVVPSAPASERQVYRLLVRGEPKTDDIHALRALLKSMLRGFGLRCLSVTREEPQ